MIRLLTAILLLSGTAELNAAQQKTTTWSRQVTDEERLEVDVGYGAGELTIERGESDLLYRAVFNHDEAVATPRHDYRNGRLDIGIRVADRGRFGSRRSVDSSLDLWLPGSVPVDLRLDVGAAEADVDLSGIPLRGFDYNTGASKSEVRIREANPERMASASINAGAADLAIRGMGNLRADRVTIKAGVGSVTLGLEGDWPADARVSVEMGVGALEVRIPADLGVRIHRESFLASIDADGFERSGRTYLSRNWEDAGRRIDLEITAALGDIDVVWVP